MLSLEVVFEDETGKSFTRKEVIDMTQFNDVLFETFAESGKGIEEAIKSLDHTLGTKLDKDPFRLLSTKACPVCAERIPMQAKKCSRCGEMLSENIQ
jgi:formylmethanofuran dehydrogenase subunit E